MKELLILTGILWTLVSCTSTAIHDVSNVEDDGHITIGFGTKNDVHIGDRVNVYEEKCLLPTARKKPRCEMELKGTLTITKVSDSTSLATPDNKLDLKDGAIFKLAKHCEKVPEDCK